MEDEQEMEDKQTSDDALPPLDFQGELVELSHSKRRKNVN